MKRHIFVAYVALLLCSWLYQHFGGGSLETDPEFRITELSDDVFIADRVMGSANGLPVILLHGSPMAGNSMRDLAAGLLKNSSDLNVSIPDMPGFGASRQPLDNYSFKFHAEQLLHWLDARNIESAHFVAYSMGGGVALSAYEVDPERFKSISMVSAIGVQELELLGSYHWNKAIHGFQLAAIKFSYWALPHFGYLDDVLLNEAYARNFFDSDQRPLRDILKTVELPMLIVHGEKDSLVPFSAAREHWRLVPHAQRSDFAGGHGLIFSEPDNVATVVYDFLRSVESGEAQGAAQASSERKLAARQGFDRRNYPALEGLALVILALSIILLSYVSEDLACIVAGLLAAGGAISLLQASVFAFAGIYSGDMLVYLGGRWALSGARSLSGARQAAPRFIRAKEFFERNAVAAVVAARFIPGTRFPIFFSAGFTRMPFFFFSLLLIVPALIWTPSLCALAYWGGEQILSQFAMFQRSAITVVGVGAVATWLVLKLLRLIFSPTARRLAWGRWQRLLHWEFWPTWIICLPLLPWFAYLAVRYRGISVFTAANPAMPDGGMAGGSKSKVLSAIDHPSVLPLLFVDATGSLQSRRDEISDFMAAEVIDYPIVIKADIGKRGHGEVICRDATSVEHEIESRRESFIVQPHIDGEEFQVFYYRLPSQSSGQVLAITVRRPLELCGDGVATLRTLILRDRQAAMMAPTHLERHAARLDWVPAAGEVLELGAYSRGGVFADGHELLSDALVGKVDEISHSYPGFFFGCYEIKAGNAAEFSAGTNLRILEVSGVTSENTSIYDSKVSIWTGWRMLARQWQLAFEIGAGNRRQGARPATALTVLRRVFSIT